MKATYIIGEIGQNHNGSVDIAKLIIDSAARPVLEKLFGIKLKGMDAIKLTKRDLAQELSASQMAQPYDNPNSFGKTYAEHRKFLELSDEQHLQLYQYAKSYGLDVIETLCAPGCISLLKLFLPDRLKVASRDLTNLPLLQAMAETGIPMILSTGMVGQKELDAALDIITKFHERLSILHCVSQYPTEPHNVNLNTITFLKKNYGRFAIGYSDHTIGISTSVAAVALGAEIIEKHITIDRHMKGTDQAGSLGLDGTERMVRDIRILEKSMGLEAIFICDDTNEVRAKLERSVATLRALRAGETVTEDAIHLLSPGDGIQWIDREKILGKRMKVDIDKDEILYPSYLE